MLKRSFIFTFQKHLNVSTLQHFNIFTMSDKKILILNQQQIQQKIDRIAYQILEDNFDETEILIAGILPRGNHIAQRLKTILDKIAPFTSRLLTIELDKQSSQLHAKTNFDVQECSDKVIVLVDDVLNSGKTLAYGFGVFLDVPLKKLRTVVLIDRNHKNFPVTTDYAGIALSTVIKEHVDVVIDVEGQEDAVYLR
ncbi:pyrimidine operon attenuation protein/uracil phosphoribosyltransferase [Mucilaginibacter sp. UYNi724]